MPATPETPSLTSLIDRGAPAAELAAHLDGLPEADRIVEVVSCGGRRIGKLYELVQGGPPATLADLYPDGATGTVTHEGRNSMALFNRFQKRVLRQADGVLLGYNHQTMSWFTGPGYFVVRDGRDDSPCPGEPYLDYDIPAPTVPEGWPPFSPSGEGLQSLVYGDMNDYVRRVANGVIVSKAFRKGKPVGVYFTLTRRG